MWREGECKVWGRMNVRCGWRGLRVFTEGVV